MVKGILSGVGLSALIVFLVCASLSSISSLTSGGGRGRRKESTKNKENFNPLKSAKQQLGFG